VTVGEIAGLIRGFRFSYTSEEQLQAAVAGAIRSQGLDVEREVTISPGCRIDMMVGRVGVEVKVHGPVSSVSRQVARYLESDRVDGIVLVTTRVRHLRIGSPGKPVEVVTLAGRL
jgi:hypothetical protein